MAAVTRIRRVLVRVTAALAVVACGVVFEAAPARADSIRDGEWWLSEYHLQQAWSRSTGEGVTVAIIDSGVDGTHPDLEGAVVGGTDVSGIGSPDGQLGVGADPVHGTLVASVLAGRGHGREHRFGIGEDGMVGVAPGASLLTISVAFGVAGLDTDAQLAEAVYWAVDHGADVINMSLTRNNPDWPRSWDDAFLYAFEHDVVVVAAAGNRSSGTEQVGAPATIPGVLTVAGLDESGEASQGASSQGVTIGVSAPSERLLGALPGGGYASWAGTSGAAPMVSGLAALIRSRYPSMDAENVINRIISTATPKTESEPDPIYGYGAINGVRALTADLEPVTANPMGDLREWIRVYRRADADPQSELPGRQPQTSGPSLGWVADSPTQRTPDPLPVVLVLIGFGAMFVVLLIGGTRHFWRIQRGG